MSSFNENHATTTVDDDRCGGGGRIGDIGEGANPSPTRCCCWRDREPDADRDLGIEADAGRITLPI
jgi:hypothetical protein